MLLTITDTEKARQIKKTLEQAGIACWLRPAMECSISGLCQHYIEVHVPNDAAMAAKTALRRN